MRDRTTAYKWKNRAGILALLVVMVLVLGLTVFSLLPYNIAPGVTPERIRALRVGMPESEVLQVLGQPLGVREWGKDATLLDYARETPLRNHSPNLWVLIREGVIEVVQANRSANFVDGEGLFLLRRDTKWEASAFAATFR